MWSLCGSSVAVLIAFIFPATCYLRLFAVDAAGATAPGAAAGGGGHGGGPSFATGDMIQARQWSGYGSGARWSEGVIVRDCGDGTFDISYDDDDTEGRNTIAVKAELIRRRRFDTHTHARTIAESPDRRQAASSSRCAARALLGAAYVVMVVCTTQNVRRALAR